MVVHSTQLLDDMSHGNLQAIGSTFVPLWPNAVDARVLPRVPS